MPGIGRLRDELYAVLKESRNRNPSDATRINQLIISRYGASLLRSLAGRLATHPWFEHQSEQVLLESLTEGVRQYVDKRSEKANEVALRMLTDIAHEPSTFEIWFGIKHLRLREEVRIGDVRFVPPTSEWPTQQEMQPGQTSTLFAVIKAEGGSVRSAFKRARDRLGPSLALLRLLLWVEFRPQGAVEEQLWFRLDGFWFYTTSDGSWYRGWWRNPSPIEFDLSKDAESLWRRNLEELNALREGLPSAIQEAVDVCLSWLEVAMREENWRVALPAIFAAMEALLVPETSGRKAELVTVRSVIVHVAGDEGFFSPKFVMDGYETRSRLVHGGSFRDVDPARLPDSVASEVMWAYLVLRNYLRFVSTSASQSIKALVREIDSSTSANKTIEWFRQQPGGEKLVNDYKEALGEQG